MALYSMKSNIKSDKNGVVEIYGMPFRFNALTDPGNKIYDKTFLADGPIISIIPGVPKFRRDDKEVMGILKKNEQTGQGSRPEVTNDGSGETAFTNGTNLSLSNESQISEWLLTSQKNNDIKKNRDLRYYRFETNFADFNKYFNILYLALEAKMSGRNVLSDLTKLKGKITGNSGIETDFFNIQRGIRFYANKNISVSEGISNSFGQSMLAGLTKQVSDLAKEAQFVLGSTAQINEKGRAEYNNNNIFTSAVESVTKFFSGKNDGSVTGELSMSLDQALHGANLIYPEIWKDSQYSKSISCSFNFISPYGTPEAILDYVYKPFLILLTLACPRQVGTAGYSYPFICKVDCPGFFTSDLAAITNMDWTKGGNEQLYSKDGLPLAITVNIQIKDLYPILMIPQNFAFLRHNTGMHGFIDNMAGISIEKFSPLKDIESSIAAKTSYILGAGKRAANRANDWAYRITYEEIAKKAYDFF